MFREFEDPPHQRSGARFHHAPRIGHLHLFRVAKHPIALALAAAMLAVFIAVCTIGRCDRRISEWLPSVFSRTDCPCDALLVEDGSPLLAENGSRICLGRPGQ
jgi:hypothetical protein